MQFPGIARLYGRIRDVSGRPPREAEPALPNPPASVRRPQPTIGSVRARVIAAVQALGAGRVDLALQELQHLERDLNVR
jgi:hypothetical protein